MKITKKGVELCGKFRRYKRTPMKQTRDHQKRIDELFDSYDPLFKKSQKLQDDFNAIEEEILDINETFSILKSKNTTDEEYDKILSLIDQRSKLRAERRELGNEIREFTQEYSKDLKKIDDDIPKTLAQLASEMVDITPEEFLEDYTHEDELMVRNLSFFKQMADAGNSEKQMQELWLDITQKDIDEKRGITPTG